MDGCYMDAGLYSYSKEITESQSLLKFRKFLASHFLS
jgi:hypothetical protein